MRVLTEPEAKQALPWAGLTAELKEALAKDVSQPLRTAHTMHVPGEPGASLLAMPAWEEGGKLAVKVLFIAPGNSARNLPAVNASVIVFDAAMGQADVAMEGAELTARRTAAVGALAAQFECVTPPMISTPPWPAPT